MKNKLIEIAKNAGATNAEIIDVADIVCDSIFRSQCESNACGVYGKCWMCPPDIGDIHELINKVKSHSYGLIYQCIFPLEDSFDFEGMQEAGTLHTKCSQKINTLLKQSGFNGFLHLGKGGCGICKPCAKAEEKPCRFPEKAMSSLEGYGLNVSATAKNTSMKYINGANTVTYFGIVLFRED